jgi:methylated-DNA-protein-cysteine methyltransferase related protein
VPYDPARHGPRRVVGAGFHQQVHDLVRTVPAGRVATYGDLAQALGNRGVARQVGWALAALPAGSDVPWWRIVAANGRVPRAGSACARRHAQALRRDGVRVVGDRVVEFALRRWQPEPA